VWNTATAKEIARVRTLDRPGHPLGIADVLFAPDGKTLAYATQLGGRNVVTLWHVASREVRADLNGQIAPIAFATDGHTFVTTHCRENEEDQALGLKVWDVMTGKERMPLANPPIPWSETSSLWHWSVHYTAFSRDGKALGSLGWIAPNDGRSTWPNLPAQIIRIWDPSTGKLQAQRLGPGAWPVATGGASWEGIYVLAPDWSSAPGKLFDPLTGDCKLSVPARGYYLEDFLEPNNVQQDDPNYKFRPTRDGSIVVLDQDDGPSRLAPLDPLVWLDLYKPNTLRLYEVATGRRLAKLSGERFACLTPDNAALVTISADGPDVHFRHLPFETPWSASLLLAAAPAGLAGLLASWLQRRREKRKVTAATFLR